MCPLLVADLSTTVFQNATIPVYIIHCCTVTTLRDSCLASQAVNSGDVVTKTESPSVIYNMLVSIVIVIIIVMFIIIIIRIIIIVVIIIIIIIIIIISSSIPHWVHGQLALVHGTVGDVARQEHLSQAVGSVPS